MSSHSNAADLAATAVELARTGARTAEAFFGKTTVSRKSDDTPVTDADHAVQAAILQTLAARLPSHAVLVEEELVRGERHAAAAKADYCWVVDPIDGTRNYARGIRIYSISVAVMHRGRPVAGAIFDASSGRTYSAIRNGGAFCDGQPLRRDVSIQTDDALLLISSFRRREIPAPVRRWMDRYVFRNLGSLSLHLACVAAGMADAAYALECKLWDIAAGALLIEESGARISDHAGRGLWPVDVAAYHNTDMPVLVAGADLHALLLPDLADAAD